MLSQRLSTGMLFLLIAFALMILSPIVQAVPFENTYNETTALKARSDVCHQAWSTNDCATPPDWTNTIVSNLNSVVDECQTIIGDGFFSVEFFKTFTLGPNCIIGDSNAKSITFFTLPSCPSGATDLTGRSNHNEKFTIQLSDWPVQPFGKCLDTASSPIKFPNTPPQNTLQSYMFNS